MKRSFQHLDSLAMANCLVLLSRRTALDNLATGQEPSRLFECKTCKKQFTSFQALGGHRASHKKPKMIEEGSSPDTTSSPIKPKSHECSICGLRFPIGQALGGHMRRHRAAAMNEKIQPLPISNNDNTKVSSPMVMKKSSSRRILCLDLNLTPLENDHEDKKAASKLHLFM